jgi:hypothetical protein
MSGLGATLLSMLTIAGFVLAGGGSWLIATGRDRKKGALMLVAAAVLAGNVLILAL